MMRIKTLVPVLLLGLRVPGCRPEALIAGRADIEAKPGQRVAVRASVSDPDGGGTSCRLPALSAGDA